MTCNRESSPSGGAAASCYASACCSRTLRPFCLAGLTQPLRWQHRAVCAAVDTQKYRGSLCGSVWPSQLGFQVPER